MRRAQDRHETGQQILDHLFPEGAAVLRGVHVGAPLADLAAAGFADEAGTWRYRIGLEDPKGYGREIVVSVQARGSVVGALTARFTSEHRLDHDAAYRLLKTHLAGAHGRPGREVTGVLTFLYDVAGGPVPARIGICRYRDSEGRNLLEVWARPQDGARLGEGPRKLAARR